MKVFFKRILWLLLIVFIAIQFIRPQKNIATAVSLHDINSVHAVPMNVQNILYNSCYDCHSNTTKYPWYNNIQPVTWFLNDHVKEGKSQINFDEFGNYRIGRQYKKLEEIKEQIEEDEMPLSSYTIIHRSTILSDSQKNIIYTWVDNLRDSIKQAYPADSLSRPKKVNAAAK